MESIRPPSSVTKMPKCTRITNNKQRRPWTVEEWGTAIVALLHVPVFTILLSLIVLMIGLLGWAGKAIQTLFALYFVYCLFDNSPRNGSNNYTTRWLSPRFRNWIRHYPPFHTVARYFPVTLHKSTDLDPKRAHIFCYHPHGVLAMGCNTALNTNGCNFDAVFPQIQRFGVTLNLVFRIPFFRDWLLWLGFISADRVSLSQTLQQGHSVVLVSGGALEALYAHPDQMILLGQHRRGFLKLALDCNALLVPCIGFGENRIFATWIPPLQQTTRNSSSLGTTTTGDSQPTNHGMDGGVVEDILLQTTRTTALRDDGVASWAGGDMDQRQYGKNGSANPSQDDERGTTTPAGSSNCNRSSSTTSSRCNSTHTENDTTARTKLNSERNTPLQDSLTSLQHRYREDIEDPQQPMQLWHRWLHRGQHLWTRWTSFSIPIVTSWWPIQTPIHVVVGEPLDWKMIMRGNIAATSNSTDNSEMKTVMETATTTMIDEYTIPPEAVLLDELHRLYWKSVQDLYDAHKANYGFQDIPLQFR